MGDRHAPVGDLPRGVTRWAPAKINLWLRVLGRRADGYHELDTVFQTLELADRVTVTCREAAGEGAASLVVNGPVTVTTATDNLCLRAASAYLARWPAPVQVKVELGKRVPAGAGLGGGSSDAAAVLLALRELLGTPHRIADLEAPARELGADVPFFLVGGTARGRGRGDLVEPLPDLEPSPLWLAVPRREVPTARVFAAYAAGGLRPERAAAVARLPADRALSAWVGGNELAPIARSLFPEIEQIYTVLHQFSFSSVQLSGSGGAVFGIPPEGLSPDEVGQALRRVGEILATETRSRPSCAL
ncbi:MAG TPA: 4-(cytidine 5'-diphospho)-2-C-methyl-D-erythritol kinase [Thermoanaerobaculia bacterium]|nr:4-(cytidine 5'-diphospho)-2-C-methyl-D-erythritol kinase [Thermoanaerobaculia bacterium]